MTPPPPASRSEGSEIGTQSDGSETASGSGLDTVDRLFFELSYEGSGAQIVRSRAERTIREALS